jgi:hypothetical protein
MNENSQPSRSTVNTTLTARSSATGRPAGRRPARGPRVVENAEFTAFGRRVLRAARRRVAAGDVDALPALVALSAELDSAIADAVAGLRAAGYSWGEIATRLGVTRQAAHQRWATSPTISTAPTEAGSTGVGSIGAAASIDVAASATDRGAA